MRAWETTIDLLRPALAAVRNADDWHVLLEYPMLRLGNRPGIILLTGHAVLVLEIKAGATTFEPADRRQVADYAIDLHDFHAGSRCHPIVPILVAEHASVSCASLPLPLPFGVAGPLDANAESLPQLLRDLERQFGLIAPPLDAHNWIEAPYRPVPTIVDAACMLYAKHGVEEIRASRADASNLTATTDAILEQIEHARAREGRLVLFVTGIPGSGKTLCGLNTIFGGENEGRGTYLTGNPTMEGGTTVYTSVEPSDVKAQDLGEAVVLTGVARIRVTTGGKPNAFGVRFTDVWAKKGGQWQMVTWQSTRLPE